MIAYVKKRTWHKRGKNMSNVCNVQISSNERTSYIENLLDYEDHGLNKNGSKIIF